ncbi:unnamed protein product [Trichobilharzia regenti]|nr:unnamed protein product [Trichobilharzia regenti]
MIQKPLPLLLPHHLHHHHNHQHSHPRHLHHQEELSQLQEKINQAHSNNNNHIINLAS